MFYRTLGLLLAFVISISAGGVAADTSRHEAQILAKKMASSWASFAAKGKPSIPGIPWEPSDPQTNKTMLWDNDCRMVNDPEGEARKIILS